MKKIEVFLTNKRGDSMATEAIRVTPVVSLSTDSLENVVGAENSRHPRIAGNIELAATPKNVAFLIDSTAPQYDEILFNSFRCVITVNSIAYFTGTAISKTILRSNNIESLVLELLDDQSDFWQTCANNSLRDLRIGEVEIAEDVVIQSWSESWASGWPVIFAPVVYGQPTGTYRKQDLNIEIERAAFHLRDLRASVYYPAIFEAIERFTGYKFESTFFTLPIFQDHVYLFSVAEEDLRDVFVPSCFFEASAAPNLYSNGAVIALSDTLFSCDVEWGEWDADTYIASEDQTFIFQIQIRASNVLFISMEKETAAAPAVWIPFFAWNTVVGDAIEGGGTFFINAGDRLRWRIFTIDDGDPDDPTFLQSNLTAGYLRGDIDQTGTGLRERTLYIESFLHDASIRDFMRGVSHQFCLAWLVDSLTKRVYVEPRFDYYIEKQRYVGFYSANRDRLSSDMQQIEFSREGYFNNAIQLYYIQGGGRRFEQRLALANSAAEGVIYLIGSEARGRDGNSPNPFWQMLTQYIGSFTELASSMLPALMEDDWIPGEPLPGGDWVSGQLRAPNYSTKGNPTCALLQRGCATIEYDDGNILTDSVTYDVPWAAQYIDSATPNGQPLEKLYASSYCESVAIRSGQEDVILNGLATMFYRTFFATVEYPEEGYAEFDIDPIFVASLPFRATYVTQQPYNTAEWILLQINDFEAASIRSTRLVLLKKKTPTLAELFKLRHWRFSYFSVAESACDERAQDVSEANENSRDVVAIQTSTGWVLPLRYPFIGQVAGEAQRLKSELSMLLMYAQVPFSEINVQVVFNFEIELWSIEIKQTTANMLYLRLDMNDGAFEQRIAFERDC